MKVAPITLDEARQAVAAARKRLAEEVDAFMVAANGRPGLPYFEYVEHQTDIEAAQAKLRVAEQRLAALNGSGHRRTVGR